MRSKGAVIFAECFPGPVAELAGRFGVAAATISAWRGGSKLPSLEKRKEIRTAGGPVEELWTQSHDRQVDRLLAASAPTQDPAATPESAVSIAAAHQAHCLALQERLRQEGPHLPIKEQITLAEKLGGMILDLGKLTGAGIVNQRQIVESPYFAQLLNDMMGALTPWPDALRAVAAVAAAKRGS
jgi:hypothetical protein